MFASISCSGVRATRADRRTSVINLMSTARRLLRPVLTSAGSFFNLTRVAISETTDLNTLFVLVCLRYIAFVRLDWCTSSSRCICSIIPISCCMQVISRCMSVGCIALQSDGLPPYALLNVVDQSLRGHLLCCCCIQASMHVGHSAIR